MIQAPDLKKQSPRSPTEELEGFVLLPRLIDKCRATIAGTNGEYCYNCPLDQRFFSFTELAADEFKNFVAAGKTDEEILRWVKQKAPKLSDREIAAWSYDMIQRRPQSVDEKAFFEEYRRKFAPQKPYISTWFELLDAEESRI